MVAGVAGGGTIGGKGCAVACVLGSPDGSGDTGLSTVSVTVCGLLIRIFFLVRWHQAPIECGKVS